MARHLLRPARLVARRPRVPAYAPRVDAEIQGLSEVERDNVLAPVGLSYIKGDPATACVIAIRKFSLLWLGNLGARTETWPPGRHPLLAIGQFGVPAISLFATPVFFAAVAGFVLLPRTSKRRATPIVLLLGWWTFAYILTCAEMRYVLPVYPCILMFGSATVVAVYRRIAGRKRPG